MSNYSITVQVPVSTTVTVFADLGLGTQTVVPSVLNEGCQGCPPTGIDLTRVGFRIILVKNQ
ncbi:MAG: hypothetical protein CM1200mP14_14180 [Gammaproteobacteria bacterium]|nr:MAG: hypothetical protein CM1200mP14_14180 [Gammaproteobacteria bacterium]